MSNIVDSLLDNAYQDTELLVKNDELGDNFNVWRNVDFILYAKDQEKADVVSSFINDNQYGEASFEKIGDLFRILVVVNMPPTQNILNSVSGLMVCLGELFDLEYDGWSTTIEKGT